MNQPEARRDLGVSVCLALALGMLGRQSDAADDIYRFIDERGSAHLSNVPSDPRYRLFLRSAVTPAFNATTEPSALILFAPPIVERGEEFAASVIFSSPVAVRGWLEISFDPAVLTLRTVGMEHETTQAGTVRLRLVREQAAFSADLRFAANARAPEQTTIALAQTSLTTVDNRSVLPTVADVIPIAISSLVR